MTKDDFSTILSQLFTQHFGTEPTELHLLPPSGSDRRYLRLIHGDKSAVGAFNPDKKENNTFFYFDRVFAKYKLPVPEIYTVSRDNQYYLLQDLGSESLLDVLHREGYTPAVKELYRKAIANLARFHWEAGKEVDFSVCFAAGTFGRRQILSDLLYFKYYFADLQKINYNKLVLLEELEEWAKGLAAVRPQTFMYRDFQGRNIQVKDGEVSFIDFQGGMLGLPQYDLASLLWQARAQLPDDWKQELLNYYFEALAALPEKPGFKESEFRKVYLECVLLRIMQTLGAYGFRGLLERKSHFIKSIPPALGQLRQFLHLYGHIPHYGELRNVLEQLVKPLVTDRFAGIAPALLAQSPLQIHTYSFSYKKGLPEDITGHGGGYVFDCRGILNPGRYDEYKPLTGMDLPVKQFLETKTLMPKFLESVYDTVDISIDDYVRRGFDRLSISFGCTGGQHRSVYAAESMARHIKEKYGLTATILHLEQQAHDMGRR
ncbi:MAG: RNase adapter RapZ [Edaphocola sp.]